MSTQDVNPHRARLIAFYQKYEPSKIDKIDANLAKYAGREDEMWRQLTGKYGPEPGTESQQQPAAPAAPAVASEPTNPAAASTTNENGAGEGNVSQQEQQQQQPPATDAENPHRARLIVFYQKYDPSKVEKVDKALRKYAGKEDEMWTTLIGKYGPEPGAESTTAAPSAAPSAVNAPDPSVAIANSSSAEPVAAAASTGASSSTDVTNQFAQQQEGSSSATAVPAKNPHRPRLIAFYQKYEPSKIDKVDANLAKYAGREEDMWRQLTGKYGPEPGTEPAAAAASDPTQQPEVAAAAPPTTVPVTAAGAGGGGGGENPHRARLVRFYQKYQPEKVDKVDTALEKYAGREEDMWKQLTGKYGPEPGAETAVASSTEPAAFSTPAPTVAETAAPAAAAAAAAAQEPWPMDHRSRLVRFYHKYAPEKLDKVDQALERYVGVEDHMWKTLTGKYGAEPEPGDPVVVAALAAAAAASATSNSAARDASEPSPVAPPQQSSSLTTGSLPGRNSGSQPNSSLGVPSSAASSVAPAPPAQSHSQYRGRLTRFYAKYLPNKIEKVDLALEKYAGQEEKMMKTLVVKYGPEPPIPPEEQQQQQPAATGAPVTTMTPTVAPAPAAPLHEPSRGGQLPPLAPTNNNSMRNSNAGAAAVSASASENSHRARLVRFYQKYQPDKLEKVDANLNKYAGREDEMWGTLTSKYGPEPPLEEATTASPAASSQVSASPAPVSKPPAASSAPATSVLTQQQQQQPQATTASSSAAAAAAAAAVPSTRDRLARYYQKYQPSKLNEVDELALKFQAKEEKLWRIMLKKYGPEPAFDEVLPPIPADAAASSAPSPSPTTDPQENPLTSVYSSNSTAESNVGGAAVADPLAAGGSTSNATSNASGASRSIASTSKPSEATGAAAAAAVSPQPKQPPEPLTASSPEGKRLARFFSVRDRAQLRNIDMILHVWQGSEHIMWHRLEDRYGPEPTDEEVRVAEQRNAPRGAGSPAGLSQHRSDSVFADEGGSSGRVMPLSAARQPVVSAITPPADSPLQQHQQQAGNGGSTSPQPQRDSTATASSTNKQMGVQLLDFGGKSFPPEGLEPLPPEEMEKQLNEMRHKSAERAALHQASSVNFFPTPGTWREAAYKFDTAAADKAMLAPGYVWYQTQEGYYYAVPCMQTPLGDGGEADAAFLQQQQQSQLLAAYQQQQQQIEQLQQMLASNGGSSAPQQMTDLQRMQQQFLLQQQQQQQQRQQQHSRNSGASSKGAGGGQSPVPGGGGGVSSVQSQQRPFLPSGAVPASFASQRGVSPQSHQHQRGESPRPHQPKQDPDGAVGLTPPTHALHDPHLISAAARQNQQLDAAERAGAFANFSFTSRMRLGSQGPQVVAGAAPGVTAEELTSERIIRPPAVAEARRSSPEDEARAREEQKKDPTLPHTPTVPFLEWASTDAPPNASEPNPTSPVRVAAALHAQQQQQQQQQQEMLLTNPELAGSFNASLAASGGKGGGSPSSQQQQPSSPQLPPGSPRGIAALRAKAKAIGTVAAIGKMGSLRRSNSGNSFDQRQPDSPLPQHQQALTADEMEEKQKLLEQAAAAAAGDEGDEHAGSPGIEDFEGAPTVNSEDPNAAYVREQFDRLQQNVHAMSHRDVVVSWFAMQDQMETRVDNRRLPMSLGEKLRAAGYEFNADKRREQQQREENERRELRRRLMVREDPVAAAKLAAPAATVRSGGATQTAAADGSQASATSKETVPAYMGGSARGVGAFSYITPAKAAEDVSLSAVSKAVVLKRKAAAATGAAGIQASLQAMQNEGRAASLERKKVRDLMHHE